MITQKYSQKQKYTISKNLGGQTHLDKKISLIFRSMGWNLCVHDLFLMSIASIFKKGSTYI